MNQNHLPLNRVRELLAEGARQQILVLGDVMLDWFVWGRVDRISPEAPVPVVEFQRESFMPGGAANVARNLAALQNPASMIGPIGRDGYGQILRALLEAEKVNCRGLFAQANRPTSTKTRIVAHQQQLVRVDREERSAIDQATVERILARAERQLPRTAAVILGDYGKGTITLPLLDGLKALCRRHGDRLVHARNRRRRVPGGGRDLLQSRGGRRGRQSRHRHLLTEGIAGELPAGHMTSFTP